MSHTLRGLALPSRITTSAFLLPVSLFSARERLTFSAGRLVEPAGPGPPLLADLGPRLLRRPLDGRLVSLLEPRQNGLLVARHHGECACVCVSQVRRLMAVLKQEGVSI